MMFQQLLMTADHAPVAVDHANVALQNSGGGGILQTIRRAIVGFLAAIFIVGALVGLVLGYFIGRTVGRRQAGGAMFGEQSSSGPSGSSGSSEGGGAGTELADDRS